MFDSSSSNALADNIVTGMPSPSIGTTSVVDERMQYGLSLHRSNLEYESVNSRSAAVTSSSGAQRKPIAQVCKV